MSAFITALSHSGGAQSQYMLEMVLRGEWEKPFRFVVLNADPGMEDSRTYRFVRETRRRCQAAGIDYITASGPSLYGDLVNMISNGATRIDNPPFWVKKPDGKRGRLAQGCTQFYKIAPMRRALRRYCEQKHGASAGTLRAGFVDMWIGFASDEWHRCSDSPVEYIAHRFPLIDAKLDRAAIDAGYVLKGIAKPPRSVCAACFANGLTYFREMYHDPERQEDWEKAVDVDNAIEDWHLRGITEFPVFVSDSLIRLRDLPKCNFGKYDEDLSEHRCNSGVCFL